MESESEVPTIELAEVEVEKFEVEQFSLQESNDLPEVALICAVLAVIVLTVSYFVFRRMQEKRLSQTNEGAQFTEVTQEESEEMTKADPAQLA